MTFKVGDKVRLKSGGPEMTVESIGNNALPGEPKRTLYCVWFEKDGVSKHSDTFEPETVEPA